jgi:hypothetical protein
MILTATIVPPAPLALLLHGRSLIVVYFGYVSFDRGVVDEDFVTALLL